MNIYRNVSLAQNIDGFLTNREGQLLYSMARACTGRGVCVEIGSWKGKSTVWLASGIIDGKGKNILYAIDPHTGSPEHQGVKKVWTFDEFQKNITSAGVDKVIKPLIETSAQAAGNINNDIELLFIDGAHEYEAVREDYMLFRSKVLEGGFIAFHDSPWPGVDQLLGEILETDGFKDVYFSDSLFLGLKTDHPSKLDRFKSKLMLNLNRQFQLACRSKEAKWKRSFKKSLIKFCRDILYRF